MRRAEAARACATHLRDVALMLYDIDIMTPLRSKSVVRVRHAVMSLMAELGHSQNNIANALNLLDHSTVWHGITVTKGCPERRRMVEAMRSAGLP